MKRKGENVKGGERASTGSILFFRYFFFRSGELLFSSSFLAELLYDFANFRLPHFGQIRILF